MPPAIPPNAATLGERFPSLSAHLDAEGLAALAGALVVETAHAGDELLSQGSPFPTLYFLWEGTFALQLGDEQSAAELGVLRAGSIVGEVAFFDGGTVTASVRAMSRVAYALALRAEPFERFAADHPKAAAGLYRATSETIAARLRVSTALFEAAAAEDAAAADEGGLWESVRALFGLPREGARPTTNATPSPTSPPTKTRSGR